MLMTPLVPGRQLLTKEYTEFGNADSTLLNSCVVVGLTNTGRKCRNFFVR